MNQQEIKEALKELNFTLSMFATVLNVSHTTVTKVVARDGKSKRVAKAISKALGLPITEVFPDVEQYKSGYSENKKQSKETQLEALRAKVA